ncbi:hypothetical protein [Flavobacterium beibuense]|uniref:hypothetical protein n=1 Tax=Flavobacterium beibuense TaxID=657326 RepID=UPI003A8E90A0
MRQDLVDRIKSITDDYDNCVTEAQDKFIAWRSNFDDNKKLLQEIVDRFNAENFVGKMYFNTVQFSDHEAFVINTGNLPCFGDVLQGFQINIYLLINGKVCISLFPYYFENSGEPKEYKSMRIDDPNDFIGDKAFDCVTDSIIELIKTFPYNQDFFQ